MTPSETCQPYTDREKWERNFIHLGVMLRNKQNQFESIVAEKKVLNDFITRHCQSSDCHIRLYDQLVSQMKRQILEQELIKAKAKAEAELTISLMNTKAGLQKLELEIAEHELADYKALLNNFSPKNPNSKEFRDLRDDHSPELFNPGETSQCKSMADDSERDFIWKQYEILDTELTNKLNAQKTELEKEKDQTHTLLAINEQLQSDINNKDEIICSLLTENAEFKATVDRLEAKSNTENVEFKATVARLEAQNKKCDNIIRALESELKDAKMKNNSSEIIWKKNKSPILKHSLTAPRNSRKSVRGDLIMAMKKEIGDSQHEKNSNKGVGSSKRKEKEVVNPISSEVPRLFSSSLKIPKLKNSGG